MKSSTHKISTWWIPTLTGVLLVLAALFFFFQPDKAFIGIALIFGWLVFTSGLMNMAFAFRVKRVFEGWIWYLLVGLLEAIMGVALLFQPELSTASVILFAGFWMAFNAISKISFAFYLKKTQLSDWKFTLFSGILMLIFSFFIIINPIFGMFSVVYMVAFPLLFIGITAIYLGLQMKNMKIVKVEL